MEAQSAEEFGPLSDRLRVEWVEFLRGPPRWQSRWAS